MQNTFNRKLFSNNYYVGQTRQIRKDCPQIRKTAGKIVIFIIFKELKILFRFITMLDLVKKKI